MVLENNRVRAKVPELFSPLMGPHLEKVDEVLSPGLTVLSWSSLNLGSFIDAVYASLNELDLLIDRVVGIHENRIEAIFKDVVSIPLCELPQTETISIKEFTSSTASLCTKASKVIDTKSQVVETAVQEMIQLLIGPEIILERPQDETAPGAIATMRKIELRTKLQAEADNLLVYYEERNIETLVQLLRSSLEMIRKRIATHSIGYGSYTTSARESKENRKADHPLFHSHIVLAMPNIVMKPSLDDIQQALNQAVSTITLVTNQVYRWGQERRIPAPPEGEKPLHSRSDIRSRSRVLRQVVGDASTLKNYHKPVSENKEVLKLVSALSTAVNSTKSLIVTALEQFNKYSHLWDTEQEEKMTQFLEDTDPGVNDFKMEMQQYAKLEEVILLEPDVIPAGCIALSSDELKLALCTEAKSWRICFGRTMRTKYQTVMEEVFKSIDDWTKRLSRPLNDLDDIRSVMATLKEIRENEIQTDMQLDPIEVNYEKPTTSIVCIHLHDWSHVH